MSDDQSLQLENDRLHAEVAHLQWEVADLRRRLAEADQQ